MRTWSEIGGPRGCCYRLVSPVGEDHRAMSPSDAGRSTGVPTPESICNMPSAMPPWLQVDVEIVHHTFGTGRVVEIGTAKGRVEIWVAFDRGDVIMLDPVGIGRHMHPRGPSDRTTRVDRSIRCDVCHGRPVVVKVTDSRGTQQFCREHKTRTDLRTRAAGARPW
jgi:hypothetical protein